MNGYDGPGEGWRQVPAHQGVGTERIVFVDAQDVARQAWVREEPVPPLPTEPYTVIRVRWKHGAHGEMNHDGGLVLRSAGWVDVAGHWINPSVLQGRITGFDVLAEPRTQQETELRIVRVEACRETAKAVLDRVREASMFSTHVRMSDADLNEVAREFGVES